MKKKLDCLKTPGLAQKSALVVIALGASVAPGLCDAAAVTSAITGVAADAGTGVTAGVTIGAVVFGARVVWSAIKSMAG
jgi:hypothetical protein